MVNFFKDDFEPEISAPVPDSTLDISRDKKVDVIISLLSEFRANINLWTERAFKTTIWSVGIFFSIVAYFLLHGAAMNLKTRLTVATGVLLLGILTQLYFLAAQRAYSGSGMALSKCEAVLGLCNIGAYIKDARFFWLFR